MKNIQSVRNFHQFLACMNFHNQTSNAVFEASDSGIKGLELFDVIKKRISNGSVVIASGIKSASAQVERLLMRVEGATIEEMKVFRGNIAGHITWLRARGHKVTLKEGRYYYVAA